MAQLIKLFGGPTQLIKDEPKIILLSPSRFRSFIPFPTPFPTIYTQSWVMDPTISYGIVNGIGDLSLSLSNHAPTTTAGEPLLLFGSLTNSVGVAERASPLLFVGRWMWCCSGSHEFLLVSPMLFGQCPITSETVPNVLDGHNIGYTVLIPWMSLIVSDPRLSFKFQRRQFFLVVSYAYDD